ncbi:MAG TPA: AbrB/MazE/SpoVT family DNA-binding domain-containing protein [Chloroflexota bacterium]|nr:AbrB/MazE/SpoVT family DNA-binding domain-containing protein [Chloroflexota bacterium]
MDTITKLSSRGQVTVPKSVRDALGLRPGDEIEFVKDTMGFRVQKRVDGSRFARWRGHFKDLEGQDPDELIEQWRGE